MSDADVDEAVLEAARETLEGKGLGELYRKARAAVERDRADAERYRALRGWTREYGRLVIGWADNSPTHQWELYFGRQRHSAGFPTLDAAIDAERAKGE